MEHVVFFPAPDGSPAFRRVAALEDAVRLVEHLRNVEGASEVSVHALTEVPLAFRAYYRVELPAPVEAEAPAPVAPLAPEPEPLQALVPEQAPEPAVLPVLELAPVEAAAPELVPAEPEPARARGPRSLGFFAS